MNFDVYCDESRHDLLTSQHPHAKYMVIGSLWLNKDNRERFKGEIHALRDRHKVGGEFKWTKATPSRKEFYVELINWFFSKELDLRFRCILVDHAAVDLKLYHENDHELGFYKFYYQVLHHWIADCNEYQIFLDSKNNRRTDRYETLKECLGRANLTSQITTLQPILSEESVFVQLCDVLTGLTSAALNDVQTTGSLKSEIISLVKTKVQLRPTAQAEQKFNIFKINLTGGWC